MSKRGQISEDVAASIRRKLNDARENMRKASWEIYELLEEIECILDGYKKEKAIGFKEADTGAE